MNKNQGSVGNELRKTVVRPIRTEDFEPAVLETVHADPFESTRRCATQLGISRNWPHHILKVTLSMFPNKNHLAQELQPRHASQWLQYQLVSRSWSNL